MHAWPSVFGSVLGFVLGSVLLTVLVLAATLIGGRVDMSCPPLSVRSTEALFAPCVVDDSGRIALGDAVSRSKIAGRSFEERWRMAAGPLSE